MNGAKPPGKEIPLEHLKELNQKIVDVLKSGGDSIKSWNSFPYELVTFGDYTADTLREQWKKLKNKAHRQCTMAQDVELVEAALKRAQDQHRGNKLPSDFPKKPGSPYALFMANLGKKGVLDKYDSRSRFVEAGKLWKELDPAKKEKFLKKYKLAMQKHGMRMEEFKAAHPELTEVAKGKKKSNKKTTEGGQKLGSPRTTSSKAADLYETRLQNFILAKQAKYGKKYKLEGEDLQKKLRKKFDRLSADKQQKWNNVDSIENGTDYSYASVNSEGAP